MVALQERLEGLPAVTRYAVLVMAAEGVLGFLTVVGRVATAGGSVPTVLGMALFLPFPLGVLGTAWMATDRRPFAWRAAIAYQVLIALFSGIGLLSSFTALLAFLLAIGGLVLLLHSDTRAVFRARSTVPPPGPAWSPPPPGPDVPQ